MKNETHLGRWTMGLFLAAFCTLWGALSLYIPNPEILGGSLAKIIEDKPLAVMQGPPSTLMAIGMIAFGLGLHLNCFWGSFKGFSRVGQVGERIFGGVGVVCLILAIGLWFFPLGS